MQAGIEIGQFRPRNGISLRVWSILGAILFVALCAVGWMVREGQQRALRAQKEELAALQAQWSAAHEQLGEIQRVESARKQDTSRRQLVGLQKPDGEVASNIVLREISRLIPQRAVVTATYVTKVDNEYIAVVAGTGKDHDALSAQTVFTDFYKAALKSPMFAAVEFDPLRLTPLKRDIVLKFRSNRVVRLPKDFIVAANQPGQVSYLLTFYLRPPSELNFIASR